MLLVLRWAIWHATECNSHLARGAQTFVYNYMLQNTNEKKKEEEAAGM